MSRPFDEARYKGLLKGLEVSELSCAEVLAKNDVFRIDPEYFGKAALAAIHRLSSFGAVPLSSVALVTDGIHESLPFVEDGPVRVLSAKHPKDNFVDRTGFETISSEYHERNPRTALQEGDVLLSTVGTIGNAAVVTPDLLPANCDRHVGIIRTNKADLSPYFVSTFLVSRYGRIQTIREATGNVQLNLFISKIGELLLPRFSTRCEKQITSTVIKAYSTREAAATKMMAAEQTLLKALGLQNWQPPEPLTYTRRASDVFTASRFDAEYFNPVKQLVIGALSSGSHRLLGDHVCSMREMFVPGTYSTYEKVRNYDLTDALQPVLDDGIQPISISEIGSTKKQFQNGDVVISRLRSYLREIAIVRTTDDVPAMGSSEFIVLRPHVGGNTQLSPELLSTYLRSQPVQTILKWCVDGSQHPRFSESDLLSIPVPEVIHASAGEIGSLVGSAEHARRQARALLEAAKRAVEIAIEQSEAEALTYLKDQGA